MVDAKLAKTEPMFSVERSTPIDLFPVRWEQTLAPIANVAGNKFIELAPGKTLTGLDDEDVSRVAHSPVPSAG